MPIELTMPRLSDTMESGTIIKWNVKEGDAVKSGTSVADVETDKATMEMQVFDDGTIAKIVVPEGKLVPIGTVIALIAESGEDVAAIGAGAAAAKGSTAPAPAAAAASAPARPTAPRPSGPAQASTAVTPAAARPDAAGSAAPKEVGDDGGGGRFRISPVARRMADEHQIDVNAIKGSGPGGRVVKDDVQAAIEVKAARGASSDAPAAARSGMAVSAKGAMAPPTAALATPLIDRVIPLSGVRQTIARRLIESKTTIPHYQVTMRFDMDALLDLRTTLNRQLENQGVKLSLNDFLLRACALAIHQHHEFNASWAGTEGIIVHAAVNIGMAISLPAERGGGLVVGVVRDADHKGLRQISAESKALAEKARSRGLSTEDMSDSTFTISNLGMFGVDHFTAIINPPNTAILAVGAAIEQPVVRNGQLAVGHQMSATLSLDHRVIDGAMAAQYLQTLKGLMENPAGLLV